MSPPRRSKRPEPASSSKTNDDDGAQPEPTPTTGASYEPNSSSVDEGSPNQEEVEHAQESDNDDEVSASIPTAKPSLARSKPKKGKYYIDEFGEGDRHDAEVLNGALDDLVASVVKCARKTVPSLGGGPQKSDALKKFHGTLQSVIETQERLNSAPEAVNKAFIEMGLDKASTTDGLDPQELIDLLDGFQQTATSELDRSFKHLKMAQVVKSKLYQSSLAVLNRLDQPEPTPSSSRSLSSSSAAYSEGLEALTEYIPVTDPFTRKPLKDIRVNARCGHVYEHKSIIDMIIASRARGIKCPYPGCRSKTLVTMDDLRKDPEMARKIADKIAEEGLA